MGKKLLELCITKTADGFSIDEMIEGKITRHVSTEVDIMEALSLAEKTVTEDSRYILSIWIKNFIIHK